MDFQSFGANQYGGPGITIREQSFDHIIKGNTITVKSSQVLSGIPNSAIEFDGRQEGQFILEGNCNIIARDNSIYIDTGLFTNGGSLFLENEHNLVYDYDPYAPFPDDQMAVPSIFAWQKGWPNAVFRAPSNLK